jgi:muconolactone delta-isomerase
VRYLVTFENVETGPLLPPQQVVGLIRSVVLPTQEALARLESEGKVRGGVTAGARAGAFILEADSHDEANQIVQSLPAWGIVKMELTPLVSFETRREHDQQVLERLEATLQQ